MADELYFLWHMEIGDYFFEFDRIMSLLLIVFLSAVVGLRISWIMEYSELPIPITTVANANKLIYGISVLEMEKQVMLYLPSFGPCCCC